MPRTARRHYLNAALFGLFSLAFAAFLAAATYYYLSGAENVTLKSFAPGVPAFFLFFLARKEVRAGNAVRKREAYRRRHGV